MPAAAEQLKITPDELRALINSHRRDFQRRARRAEREFDAELRRVALAKLLELMRSANEAAAMFAAGTVIRYELARKYKMHMGIDVAFGPDGAAFYVQVGSAWFRP